MRKRLAILTACAVLASLVASAEARNGVPKTNCRLDEGKISLPGYPLYDSTGVQVATKRVELLWRYLDANCDGVMEWGPGPAEGVDYLRIVPRTIYDFTGAVAPAANAAGQVQLSTHHFGPFDATIGPAGAYRRTALREVHHDDLLQGLPAPGDFVVTQGPDGPPVPGLSLAVHLFTDAGDTTSVPGVVSKWGARYVLTFDPATSSGAIPAGTYMFMDTQLNVYNVVPSADGTCEFGFSEEDWINVNGGGPVQSVPNTANTTDPNVVPVPVRFAPQCSNNIP